MQGTSHNVIVRIAAASAAAWLVGPGLAAELNVTVVDATGKPVANVAIVATSASVAPATLGATHAVMDQIDKQFVPELLVIRTGTTVSFPNSDKVAHQVYSFSPSKRFSLPLYRGKPYPPVAFDQSGVVTLGCNIHDNMVGYVLVTDAPYFGTTDANGRWRADVVAGTYKVSAWHPRLRDALPDQSTTSDGAHSLTFKLTKALKPAPRALDDRTRDY